MEKCVDKWITGWKRHFRFQGKRTWVKMRGKERILIIINSSHNFLFLLLFLGLQFHLINATVIYHFTSSFLPFSFHSQFFAGHSFMDRIQSPIPSIFVSNEMNQTHIRHPSSLFSPLNFSIKSFRARTILLSFSPSKENERNKDRWSRSVTITIILKRAATKITSKIFSHSLSSFVLYSIPNRRKKRNGGNIQDI